MPPVRSNLVRCIAFCTRATSIMPVQQLRIDVVSFHRSGLASAARPHRSKLTSVSFRQIRHFRVTSRSEHSTHAQQSLFYPVKMTCELLKAEHKEEQGTRKMAQDRAGHAKELNTRKSRIRGRIGHIIKAHPRKYKRIAVEAELAMEQTIVR